MFNQADQRKPFDSTVCFTFFGDWMQAIESVEREEDRGSVAYQLFKAVACFLPLRGRTGYIRYGRTVNRG